MCIVWDGRVKGEWNGDKRKGVALEELGKAKEEKLSLSEYEATVSSIRRFIDHTQPSIHVCFLRERERERAIPLLKCHTFSLVSIPFFLHSPIPYTLNLLIYMYLNCPREMAMNGNSCIL